MYQTVFFSESVDVRDDDAEYNYRLAEALNREMNGWLKENPNIEIVQIKLIQSSTNKRIDLATMILYKAK